MCVCFFYQINISIFIGVIVSINNTASIITLALPTSDNNNNNINSTYYGTDFVHDNIITGHCPVY